MALKASPEIQALLLDLQAIDTRLAQLEHRAKTLPEHAALAELGGQADELRKDLLEKLGSLEDARIELKRIESDVELVEARIRRDTERLDASSSVKDVQGLEAELTSLRKRQSDLEDIELAVMERVEEAEAAEREARTRLDDVAEKVKALEADRDAALEGIRGEQQHANANRQTIVGRVPDDLLALYERQRERYGAGASLLQYGVSSASGVKLNESDLAEIRAAAPDDVLLCPTSNAILVRTSESGL
ncbi:zinc ribbon domain-containing protein [Cryobacterium sp. BB736]|uniref:zinc ribbon domain-containing protein n=1 Tax=Cryobacterium sp. BB736 TaxID=2746963 RepID=UPI001D0BF2CA|nr:hypothetical protein [Cryobacterium sp. BB736]